jgi:hydrophobic/amphiphilic exporter-1 (mainly G- bacteria), HAE1 family
MGGNDSTSAIPTSAPPAGQRGGCGTGRVRWSDAAAGNSARLNQKFAALPEAEVFAFLPPAIPGIGQASGVEFFVRDRAGKGVDYLWDNTQKFLAAARKRGEFARMNLTFSPSVPQMYAAVDHDKVFKLGVSISAVYRALQTLLGGYYVNQFNRFGRVWKVFVEAEPRYRTRATDVGHFYVCNNQGDMVPLSTLVNMKRVFGPEYTARFNEYRSIEIFAQPAPGYSTGDAMAAVTMLSNSVLPRDMGTAWNGISYQQAVAGNGAAVFALSLVLVFLILAARYESWSLPFGVLLSVPVAVCGAFVGPWSRHFDNDVYAQVGLIMLIGLSAKNAILTIEFAKAELDKERSIIAAALSGARQRLRPILMTSFAFCLRPVPALDCPGSGRGGTATNRHRHHRWNDLLQRICDLSRPSAVRAGRTNRQSRQLWQGRTRAGSAFCPRI